LLPVSARHLSEAMTDGVLPWGWPEEGGYGLGF